MELRRHHVARRHAVLLDQLEHAFGRPLVHEDDGMPEVQRAAREHEHGRVVERRAADVDVVTLRLDAEHAEEHTEHREDDVGIERHQRPAHAFRSAGRAGRVVHHLARRAIRRRRVRLAAAEVLVRPEAGHGAHREAALGREVDLVARRFAGRGEAFGADEHLRARVLHDVRDLGRGQVMVDRHEVHAALRAAEIELDHRRAVRQHGGDDVALPEAERPEPVRDAVRAREQLACGELLVGRHQREMGRVLLCEIPEAVFRHGREGVARAAGAAPAPGARERSNVDIPDRCAL
jgi:hypothetical protein